MFRFKLKNAKTLKDLLSAVSIMVDEATFSISPDNITLRAMDPSHVAMVDLLWQKEAFDEYVCDAPTKICIGLTELLKLLKRVSENETADISLDGVKLNITLQGDYARKFSIPTIDIAAEEEVPNPKTTFTAKIELGSVTLKNIIDDAGAVSDHIVFEATDKFIVKAEGDLGNMSNELTKDSKTILGFQVEKEAKSIYALSYLADIVKAASPNSDVVKLEFTTGMPIKLTYLLDKTKGSLSYYLAPRIE
jgi:proliferating cell nuclear antigen